MQRIAIIAFALLLAHRGHAEPARIDRAIAEDYGIYEAIRVETYDAPNAVGGVRDEVVNVELVERTTVVPARLCVRFGVWWRLMGPRPGGTADVKVVVTVPPAGLRDPSTGTIVHGGEDVRTVRIGDRFLDGYEFSYPWELVPGRWAFEIWQDNRMLGRREFDVVDDGGIDKNDRRNCRARLTS